MDQRRAIQLIDATLKSAGFKEVGPGFADYEGAISVHGKPVRVKLHIPSLTFVPRPQVHLIDRNEVPVQTLAHVEIETGICYASAAGFPLDLYEPGPAVLRVLEEARLTLEKSFGGRGLAELVDEYQSYWRSTLPVFSFFPKSQFGRTLDASSFIALRDGKPQFLGLARTPDLPGYICKPYNKAVLWTVDGALGPAPDFLLPKTLNQLEAWFKAQSSLQDRTWEDAYSHLVDGGILFLAAKNAFLGVELKLPSNIKAGVSRTSIRKTALPALLKRIATKIEIERYSGKWASISDVVSRNNRMTPNLSHYSVALIGCGTIGGYLARLLAQSGAGSTKRFTLIDPDHLTVGNLGRHLLGFADLGRPKVEGISSGLNSLHPQISTYPLKADALSSLTLLSEHELVIDATGDWNVQSALNEWFLGSPGVVKALLHSWIFMNGSGAQSFLNLRDEYACFRCLKNGFDGRWRYPAGDEDDELNLQPATCGDGAFVPFTSDVSMIAAGLSGRAAIDWAAGEPGPRLRTIQTDLDRGRSQKPRYPSKLQNCPACSARPSVAQNTNP